MELFPHFLIIAGTGRNTGKTSLACALIQHFSKNNDLVGIKISPHFHNHSTGTKPIIKHESYTIYQESSPASGKDSSLMLKAGAMRVFYIEVEDNHLAEALKNIRPFILPNTPVIIESPGLRKIISPGLFIIVDHPQQENKKQDIVSQIPNADLFIDTSKNSVDSALEKIKYSINGWLITRD